jgi:hypothetical protein
MTTNLAGRARRTVTSRLSRRTATRLVGVRDRRVSLARLLAQRALPGPVRRGLAAGGRIWVRDPSLQVVQKVGRAYLARPLDTPQLTVLTARNLAMVVDILEHLDIEYFIVDNRSQTRTAVAIRESERARLFSELRERWAYEPVYIRLARGGVTSFERPQLARRALRMAGAQVSEVLRVYLVHAAGSFVAEENLACDIEFWRENRRHGELIAPRDNRVTPSVPVDVPATRLTIGERDYRSIEPFSVKTPMDIDFPIDIVYTWVDGSDPDWAVRRDKHLGVTDSDALNRTAANVSRYLSRDELRYSLRSIEMFAPWVRRIFIVTDNQVPAWLDQSSKAVVVDHREIFADPSVLPAFNSHAIESQLHHVDGLAEHYLYLNDDMLFGRPVSPANFFGRNGLPKIYLSPARIEWGEPSIDDLPVMAAAKNNREILLKDFGRYVSQKQKHTPYPHLRSVMYEMEERYAEDFARTAASRFRHPSDISIASSLQQYYTFLTGRAVLGSVGYTYVDLADPSAPVQLTRLRKTAEFDTFCLNDTDSDDVNFEEQMTMVRSFFEDYFPLPSSFERS